MKNFSLKENVKKILIEDLQVKQDFFNLIYNKFSQHNVDIDWKCIFLYKIGVLP
jgi:hypothetical protein